MKSKILQYTLIGCSVMALFSACRKDPFNGKETKESGKTYVYIEQVGGSQTYNQFFDVFTSVKAINMFTVRRDAASRADLQKAVTVSIKAMDQSYIDAYNNDNGTNFTLLPSSIYTLATTESGVAIGASGDLTLNFAGGDFAKNIIFDIDGSKVDLSKQYAVAYVITDFGGFSKEHSVSGVSQDTIISTVAIKNRWDGIYTAKGTMTDLTNASLTDFQDYIDNTSDGYVEPGQPMQYEFRTVSATTVELYDNYFFGGYYFPINSGGGYSQYGNFSPAFTFDPATNKVVSVTNHYGQEAGSQHRSGRLDPSGPVNAYNPSAKTVTVTFDMTQPYDAGICSKCSPNPPYVRSIFDYVFTYIGSR
ncbi:MAG TPA: DUF1735 domain-containing protein [Mucilaginibacter sp.]|nr:DUF1735 domain-containing protein [Mucilaginibacter sp.]